jgi:putative sterol carrier protein
VRPWVIAIRGENATARSGNAGDPKLTITADTAAFLRIAARDLDPGKALLNGQLTLDGDFEVAAKLAEMFGEPSSY